MRTYTLDPNEPVVLRHFRFAYQAEVARALLEAAEIPCAVVGDSYTEVAGVPVRLVVRRGDVDDDPAASEDSVDQ